MKIKKLFFAVSLLFVLASCGGGGGATDATPTGNDVDTTDVPPSSNADDASVVDASDTDGDGVSDLLDVAPTDAGIDKAVQFDLTDTDSLGFGQVLNVSSSSVTSFPSSPNNTMAAQLLDSFLAVLFPKAHAEENLAALSNTIAWDENGNIVATAILSSETLFIAEAAVSPDGAYVYLLTSSHIQRALPELDPEVCSIYRVKLEDMSFSCLLSTDDGDIEPKSLIGTQSTDFHRRGMAFRSDGAAVMQGFDNNAELPDGVSGGTQNTTGWFMDSQGVLTPIAQDFPYYAVGVFWLTDESFAVAEFANTENLEEGMNQERFAIYSADTLQRTNVVIEGITNFGLPMVQLGNDVYWDSYVLRGDSLLVESSGGEGYPLLDPAGERMLFLVDYIQSQRDPEIANSERNRIFSIDGAIRLELSSGDADWYERTKQSGAGTDIKYPPVGMSTAHIAYRKSYEPTEPIQTVEGEAFARFQTYELSGSQGTLEVEASRDIFLVRPDENRTGDLSITYSVLTAANASETRTLTVPAQVITEWREEDGDADYIEWASPSPQREGFCVFEFADEFEQCVNFDEYLSLAVDAEYFSRTAPPGVQNTLLVGDQLRVFFKDSSDQTYYKAEAAVADFMEQGYAALAITPAVNGAGDLNIVSDAINLSPLEPKALAGVVVQYDGDNSVSIDFGQSLSSYGALPSFTFTQGDLSTAPSESASWGANRRVANLRLEPDALSVSEMVTLNVQGPIFLPDQTRQYQPADSLVFQID